MKAFSAHVNMNRYWLTNEDRYNPQTTKTLWSNVREAKYLWVSKNGILHPVINETTIVIDAENFTIISLRFLTVLNNAAK